MSTSNQSFLIHKTELNNTKIHQEDLPELEDGDVLLKIDLYAMTSNNITYAVTGHKLRYWQFFPTQEPFGIVPVWGFADVVESKNEGIKVGQRYYGYYPMSSYLKVKAGKVYDRGFTDIAEHRSHLPALYNNYSSVKVQAEKNMAKDGYTSIFRPLFTTSFLNYHFLSDNNFFEADQIVITSASSKTGLSLGYMLKKNQDADGKKVIGLTSTKNVDFVKSTGCYDEVIAYDNIKSELNNTPSTIVDMAGNSGLLSSTSEFLGENLMFISLIGLTDWTSGKDFKELQKSKFFFAPTVAQTMIEKWGPAKTNQEIAQNLSGFIVGVNDWMELAIINDMDTFSNLYHEMLKGKVDPSKGYIIQM